MGKENKMSKQYRNLGGATHPEKLDFHRSPNWPRVRAKRKIRFDDMDEAFRHYMLARRGKVTVRLKDWITQHHGTELEQKAIAQVRSYVIEQRKLQAGNS